MNFINLRAWKNLLNDPYRIILGGLVGSIPYILVKSIQGAFMPIEETCADARNYEYCVEKMGEILPHLDWIAIVFSLPLLFIALNGLAVERKMFDDENKRRDPLR